jgi:hypothetical protein
MDRRKTLREVAEAVITAHEALDAETDDAV